MWLKKVKIPFLSLVYLYKRGTNTNFIKYTHTQRKIRVKKLHKMLYSESITNSNWSDHNFKLLQTS